MRRGAVGSRGGRIIALCCAALVMNAPQMASSAENRRTVEPKIPSRPSAPPTIQVQEPTDYFHCDRYFVHDGKKIACDSHIRQDAEHLRPIVEQVPEALAELELYQRNRRTVRNAAYVGTLGLVIAAVGFFFSQRYLNEARDAENEKDITRARDLRSTGDLIEGITVYGGLALTGGSVIYGISLLTTNELHLGNAVQLYNRARPDRPIELQFTTGIAF